jgi:SAM-dependent methyltransferase
MRQEYMMEIKERKLNLGCGTDIRDGFDNLDMHDRYGADIVHNLDILPLPIKDNIYDYVYCCAVLEHVHNPVRLIYEMIRITKPKGRIEIIVPNETIAWSNIWHVNAFTMQGFKLFGCDDLEEGIPQQVNIIESRYIALTNNTTILSNIYSNICVFGANIIGCNLMDSTFLKWLFPLVHIKIVFEKMEKDIMINVIYTPDE